MKFLSVAVFVLAAVGFALSANGIIKNVLSLYGNGLDIPPYDNTAGISSLSPYASLFRRRCPLCDSSVYSYCSDKLFHDSCCCHNPNNPYDRLPLQCRFADCSFLHANTCQEHKLISACCCTSVFLQKK
ncbi:uncharacterized protein LOC108911504 [Anoplophora glabripennis]|uniref:uncharacterized protein LOC108911504 n=1 Tax=Anoplophora glabripennis TaxID=217634 RepID=UPI0008751A8E|nr:uncharacterized protein LOC108911504 [Anoplophora glabripennis]